MNMKKLLSLFMTVVLVFSVIGCGGKAPGQETESGSSVLPAVTDSLQEQTPSDEKSPIDKDGWYYSKEDVALYIHTYGHLPDNFITKDEARDLGWEGGSVEEYAPGYAIGGDRFGNREGRLPKGHTYYECDIDTKDYHSRGSRRIVFSDDGLIYYTHDHYENFELLYGEE